MLGDMLAEANEISQLTLKRPMDRVSDHAAHELSFMHNAAMREIVLFKLSLTLIHITLTSGKRRVREEKQYAVTIYTYGQEIRETAWTCA
jgi:hypothetical protein